MSFRNSAGPIRTRGCSSRSRRGRSGDRLGDRARADQHALASRLDEDDARARRSRADRSASRARRPRASAGSSTSSSRTRRGSGRADDYTRGTITRVPRPQPVPMTDAVARNFNGIWLNANGGIHFDTAALARRAAAAAEAGVHGALAATRGRRRSGPLDSRSNGGLFARGFPAFSRHGFSGRDPASRASAQLVRGVRRSNACGSISTAARCLPIWQPNYYGFTTGRWEGNTLVTKTIGLCAATR